MRKPLFFSLLAGIALASSFASSPADAQLTRATKVKLTKGRFVLVLSPTAINGKPYSQPRPSLFAGGVYRNAAGGFVMGGKGSPHLTGTISGTSFKAHDDGFITLEGKVSSNETLAAASGKYVITGKTKEGATGTMSGTFALVPFTSAGGKLLGGGAGVNKIPNGWGKNIGGSVGAGMGTEWGYQGGGLFSALERPNLGGTTVSGQASSDVTIGKLWDDAKAAWNWAFGNGGSNTPGGNTGQQQADGTHSTNSVFDNAGAAFSRASDGKTGSDLGQSDGEQKTMYEQNNTTPPPTPPPAADGTKTESQDDRDTYGTGGLNSNFVLKGQDGTGSQWEFPAGTSGSGLRTGPNKGDNPFEISGADQLNIGKLMNGAIDPSPGH